MTQPSQTPAPDPDYPCPTCHQPMTFVRDIEFESHMEGSRIVVPLASSIYRCATHGLWRCFISGAKQPWVEPKTS